MQSVLITTEVVNTNPAHGEVYSIQHYVINFSVICERSVVSSTKLLLKVALNINPTHLMKVQITYNALEWELKMKVFMLNTGGLFRHALLYFYTNYFIDADMIVVGYQLSQFSFDTYSIKEY